MELQQGPVANFHPLELTAAVKSTWTTCFGHSCFFVTFTGLCQLRKASFFVTMGAGTADLTTTIPDGLELSAKLNAIGSHIQGVSGYYYHPAVDSMPVTRVIWTLTVHGQGAGAIYPKRVVQYRTTDNSKSDVTLYTLNQMLDMLQPAIIQNPMPFIAIEQLTYQFQLTANLPVSFYQSGEVHPPYLNARASVQSNGTVTFFAAPDESVPLPDTAYIPCTAIYRGNSVTVSVNRSAAASASLTHELQMADDLDDLYAASEKNPGMLTVLTSLTIDQLLYDMTVCCVCICMCALSGDDYYCPQLL